MKKIIVGLCTVGLLLSATATAQTCRDDIVDSHPDGQYIDNLDGTVTDVANGLMWMRCSLGQTYSIDSGDCTGEPNKYNSWKAALVEANDNASFGGFDNWRLPNIKELGDLVERSCVDPAINLTSFPSTSSGAFWSNTMDAHEVNATAGLEGMLVDFTSGVEYLENVKDAPMIRMVRKLTGN